jgi:hypothetical protein
MSFFSSSKYSKPIAVLLRKSCSIDLKTCGSSLYSGLIREQVLGDPAEIESIFVSSPYSNINGELEVEAVIKGLGESSGLELAFWTETPSGKFEQLADVKTKKMSKGDETAYKAKIKPKEEWNIERNGISSHIYNISKP